MVERYVEIIRRSAPVVVMFGMAFFPREVTAIQGLRASLEVDAICADPHLYYSGRHIDITGRWINPSRTIDTAWLTAVNLETGERKYLGSLNQALPVSPISVHVNNLVGDTPHLIQVVRSRHDGKDEVEAETFEWMPTCP